MLEGLAGALAFCLALAPCQLGESREVGLEPAESLLSQTDSFLVVEFVGVFALACCGQDCRAGGVVAMPRLDVFRSLGFESENFFPKARRSSIEPLGWHLAQPSQGNPLRVVNWFLLPLEDGR